MLAAAVEDEVAAYVEAHCDRLDANGRRLVVRNGYSRDQHTCRRPANGEKVPRSDLMVCPSGQPETPANGPPQGL